MTAKTWIRLRVVVLAALALIVAAEWFLVLRPANRLLETIDFLSEFSVGMMRSDIVEERGWGQPTAKYQRREDLVKAFPDYRIPHTEVNGAVLCYLRSFSGRTPNRLALFYLDSQDMATTVVLLERQGTAREGGNE